MAKLLSALPQLILVLAAFGVLNYFIVVKPQQAKRKAMKDMRTAIKVGDQVITVGGICGVVAGAETDVLVVQVADGVCLRIMRQAIGQKIQPSTVEEWIEKEEDETEADEADENK